MKFQLLQWVISQELSSPSLGQTYPSLCLCEISSKSDCTHVYKISLPIIPPPLKHSKKLGLAQPVCCNWISLPRVLYFITLGSFGLHWWLGGICIAQSCWGEGLKNGVKMLIN